MILIFMFVIIMVTIINAVCRAGKGHDRSGSDQKHTYNAANDYLQQEMIRQHQQASQDAIQRLAYDEQSAVRMMETDIHRIQAQQVRIHQQMADIHQNNNDWYGSVRIQQDLQLFADHVDAGDRFQSGMFQEHYDRIADHMNVGYDGFGMF